MFVSLLLRQTEQRPVLGASELQRRLAGRQGAGGEVPVSNNASWRVPTEQAGVVRHARQCVAMVRQPDRSERSCPGAPGRLLEPQRLPLPGGLPPLARADQPVQLPGLPPGPSSVGKLGQQARANACGAWSGGQSGWTQGVYQTQDTSTV